MVSEGLYVSKVRQAAFSISPYIVIPCITVADLWTVWKRLMPARDWPSAGSEYTLSDIILIFKRFTRYGCNLQDSSARSTCTLPYMALKRQPTRMMLQDGSTAAGLYSTGIQK
jgi:hypothetical protein